MDRRERRLARNQAMREENERRQAATRGRWPLITQQPEDDQ